MKKVILGAVVGAALVLGIAATENSANENGRYKFYISPYRPGGDLEMNYVIDSKTGKVWEHTVLPNANVLKAVPYQSLDGRSFLIPPDDGVTEVTSKKK